MFVKAIGVGSLSASVGSYMSPYLKAPALNSWSVSLIFSYLIKCQISVVTIRSVDKDGGSPRNFTITKVCN